jgi:hypothetical protein
LGHRYKTKISREFSRIYTNQKSYFESYSFALSWRVEPSRMPLAWRVLSTNWRNRSMNYVRDNVICDPHCNAGLACRKGYMKTLFAVAVVLVFGSLSFANPVESDPAAVKLIDHSIHRDINRLLHSAAMDGTIPLVRNNLAIQELGGCPDPWTRGCCRGTEVIGYFQCSQGQRCLWGAQEGYYFEDSASCAKPLADGL